MAKVAIVLPSFNRPTLVRKMIESVIDQTFNDWNLYIMDNSSPGFWPKMREIYVQYAEDDPRIKIDHTEVNNSDRYEKWWCAVVINKALFELSEGEPYIIMSVDDGIMMPRKLEVLAEFLDTHPDVSMVAGMLEIVSGKNHEGKVWRRHGGEKYRSGCGKIDFLQPMYRRELIDKTGELNTKMGPTPLDIAYFHSVSKFHNGVHGVPVVLDRSLSYTYGTRHHKFWRDKALKGETME